MILNPFDVVKVAHIKSSTTYGVVEEISHITDTANFLFADEDIVRPFYLRFYPECCERFTDRNGGRLHYRKTIFRLARKEF